jgi:hypothetical protein
MQVGELGPQIGLWQLAQLLQLQASQVKCNTNVCKDNR